MYVDVSGFPLKLSLLISTMMASFWSVDRSKWASHWLEHICVTVVTLHTRVCSRVWRKCLHSEVTGSAGKPWRSSSSGGTLELSRVSGQMRSLQRVLGLTQALLSSLCILPSFLNLEPHLPELSQNNMLIYRGHSLWSLNNVWHLHLFVADKI